MASTPVAPEVSQVEASLGPGRHEARERAVGLLYESEAREMSAAELLEQLPLRPNVYAVSVLEGVEHDRESIDALIDEHASGWTIDRLPNVDRAILRMATWELLTQEALPAAVVINEAIELAKDYSTERSSSFVNGVLDSIASAVRSVDATAAEGRAN